MEKEALFHVRSGVEVGGVSLQAHLYLDERRRAEEIEWLIRDIEEIERKLKEKKSKRKEVGSFIEGRMKGGKKLFMIRLKGGAGQVKRNEGEIEKFIERTGKMIIVANEKRLGREEVLYYYRKKDRIEKLFKVMKNEIEGRRLRISFLEGMEGRIFISFITLILWSAISEIMRERERGLFEDYTVAEVLYELRKLRVVEMMDGRRYLT